MLYFKLLLQMYDEAQMKTETFMHPKLNSTIPILQSKRICTASLNNSSYHIIQ